MKCINMHIVSLIYKDFFIVLKIKVALISYSLSKAASTAAENNGLIALITSLLAVPWPEWGIGKQMMATTPNSSCRG